VEVEEAERVNATWLLYRPNDLRVLLHSNDELIITVT